MMKYIYRQSREWDCYHDREEDGWYHNWLGIYIRGVFVGIHWITWSE